MIDVSKAMDALKDYGLSSYQIQKYLIMPNRVYSALLNNRAATLTVQDVSDLCDLLCCRPDDIIRYDYVDPVEAAINEALADGGEARTADDETDDSIRSDIIKELLG